MARSKSYLMLTKALCRNNGLVKHCFLPQCGKTWAMYRNQIEINTMAIL